MSSVSGGSIVGAYLCLKWPELRWDNGRAANLDEMVISPLRRLCRRDIDTLPTGLNAIVSLWGGSHSLLASAYRTHLFSDARLKDLPESPRCLILGSNLQTGAPVAFDRTGLTESRLGRYANDSIPISVACAVSSAYAPYLSPVVLRTNSNKWSSCKGADLPDNSKLRARLVLTDGGMHDPLAILPVWGECDTLLVSDASQVRAIWRTGSFWLRQLARTTLVQTFGNSGLTRSILSEIIKRDIDGLPRGAHWSSDDKMALYKTNDKALVDSPSTHALASMRTRLAPFSEGEQAALINWGYALCDAAMRERFGLANEPQAKLPLGSRDAQ